MTDHVSRLGEISERAGEHGREIARAIEIADHGKGEFGSVTWTIDLLDALGYDDLRSRCEVLTEALRKVLDEGQGHFPVRDGLLTEIRGVLGGAE